MKIHTNTTVALKPNFMSFLLYVLYFFKYVYSSITLKIIKIFIIKIPKDSLFIFLGLNAVFITVHHDKAVHDDISAKAVPI